MHLGLILVAAAVAFGIGAFLVGAFGDGDTAEARSATTLTIGGAPGEVVFAGGQVWTLDLASRRLRAFDPDSGELLQSTVVGEPGFFGTDLAVGAGRVWVSLGSRQEPSVLARVNPQNGEVRLTRLDRSVPQEIVVGPEAVWLLGRDRLARVGHRPGGRVRPNSVRSLAGAKDVASGYGSTWVVRSDARSEDGGSVLVRIEQSSGEVEGRRRAPGSATSLAVGFGAVWIANGCAGGVVRAPVGPGPARCRGAGEGITAIAIGGGSLWAADYDGSALLRLDPTSGAATARVPLGARPDDLAIGGGAVWAVSRRGLLYRAPVDAVGEPTLPGVEASAA